MAGQGGLDADAMWAELKKADSSKIIDASHIPTSVLDGRWVKKTGDTMTGALTSASSSGSIVFKGLENCDITNIYKDNGVIRNDDGGLTSIRNGLRFNWYDTYWYIGNLRGSGTESAGFGVVDHNNKLVLRVTPNDVRAPRFMSTVATGVSPLIVSSNTLVNNLNADLLDGFHQSSFLRVDGVNQYVTLSGGNGNNEGYRLVFEGTVTVGWSINSMTLLVNSRHAGTGMISIVFHTTNQESTSYIGSLNYYGSTISLGDTMWRLFYNTTTKKVRLFWRFYDYSDCQVLILNRRGITINISNKTWYTTIPSDSGSELPAYYNWASSAHALATSRTLWGQPFNGTANVSGNMTGVGSITMSGQLTSTVASGTAPFIVVSNTVVGNLNADMVDGLHLSDFDGRYVNVTGDTMIGDLTMNNKGFNIVQGTRVVKSSSNWIHGGSDVASVDDANLRFGSWQGIGWYPTVSGQTVAQGKNAMWLNVRTGALNVAGGIKESTICIGRVNSAGNYDAAYNGEINRYDHHLYLQRHSGKYLIMCTGGGLAGIGTNSPGEKLHVAGNTRTDGYFKSTVGTGTAPYQCSSTTLNTNLNADMLDNWHLNFLPRNYNIGRCYAVKFALGGTDNGWKKIFACSESGATPYKSVTVWGRIWYAYGNHAQSEVWNYHFCAIFYMRSGPRSSDSSVGNVENSARLFLPTFAKGMDNIRLVRVGTNNFELQVRQIGSWHNANIEYQYNSYGCNVSAWENLQSTSNTSVAVSAGGASTLADSRASSADVLTTSRTLWGQPFNGTANVSGNMTGVGSITMSGQLTSTVASGTAPFIVVSNTVVGNLNADMVDGLHLSDFDGRYVNVTGDTMIGDLTMNNKGFNIVQGTRVVKSSSNWIHGGSDVASVDDANLRFGSWQGIGWYPTVSGQTVAQGKNAMWLNVRTGALNVAGGIKESTICIGRVNSAGNYDAAYNGEINRYDHHLYLQRHSGKYLIMCTGGGLAGIGTNSPGEKLHVAGNTRTDGYFKSTVGTGTAPYQCSSTTLNTNLNADMLDNWHLNFLPRNYNIGRCYAVKFALGGTDNGWKKIFACSESGATPYKSVTVWGRIWYAYGNHAQSEVWNYHFCAIFYMRSGPRSSDSSVGNVENSARLFLPTFAKGMDNIRLVRVGTNNFELQVRQIGSWHNANIEYQYNSYGCNVSAWENLQSTSNTSVAVSAGGASTLADSRASSADVLTTSRTLWGRPFNGSANIDGNIDNAAVITSKGGIWLDLKGSSGVAFYSGGSLCAVINNTGVGIGTSSPSQKLHVAGNIIATGAITAKASSSDIRLKTDIQGYDAMGIIRKFRSVKYHWNAIAKENSEVFNHDNWNYGLIAQDLLSGGYSQWVKDAFNDYYTIDYERLIPVVWKGLQEVDDEVTRLKKRVKELEKRLGINNK